MRLFGTTILVLASLTSATYVVHPCIHTHSPAPTSELVTSRSLVGGGNLNALISAERDNYGLEAQVESLRNQQRSIQQHALQVLWGSSYASQYNSILAETWNIWAASLPDKVTPFLQEIIRQAEGSNGA